MESGTRKRLFELLQEERSGKTQALEIAGLLASYFQHLDLTIWFYRNGSGLFYSTLPEDEAAFYTAAIAAGKNEDRPGSKHCKWVELLPGGGYGGFAVLEGEPGGWLVDAEDCQFIQDCAFAMAFCMLLELTEANYELDPLTGVFGRPAFKLALKALLEDRHGKGYLLAACYDAPHGNTGYWTEGDDDNYRMLAERSQTLFGTAYRISDTVIAMLTDDTDRAKLFAGLQELTEVSGYVGAVYLPLSSLTTDNVFHRLDACIAQCSDGMIHGPERMPAKLPFRRTAEMRADG